MTKNNKSSEKKLKVTLMLSKFGRKPNHAECVKGLGLRRIRDSVVVQNTACIRGMIDKVSYLLKIEEV
ncbi:MAG: 50S ribosomal protein L30 [Gammaproteobacteria bacterium]|nr:50S ribosomal protein L30 [Gammaproteobacteria bacterium]